MVRRASGAIALVAAAVLAGCGGQKEEPKEVVAQAVTPPPLPSRTAKPDQPRPTATATARPKRRSTAILSPADLRSFKQLGLGGRYGLAVSGVGRGQKVQRTGTFASGIAWSTSKVPVALAVIAAGKGEAERADMAQALTASDNAAATRMWQALGTPEQAAAATDEQLARAGDGVTHTESQAIAGGGYTPFGQTVWSLADQTRFTAGMACLPGSDLVLSFMGQVVPGQRWGLGATGYDAQFKGGWGPGTEPGASGGWLDRQMGLIRVKGKPLAVSIAAADGSHETSTRALTTIARCLVSHADVSRLPSRPAC
jgi:hypothetical protein